MDDMRMNKRLRKKKRLGEFRVMAVPVQFWLDGDNDEVLDSFLDALYDFTEYCGITYGFGVGHNGKFRVFVEREIRHGDVMEHAGAVACLYHPAIREVQIGTSFDAWHAKGDDDLDDGLPSIWD